jgi:filamentous hemagglutinin family protein
MNHTYRLIFNIALNTWVAVAECARGRGKLGTTGGRRARRLARAHNGQAPARASLAKQLGTFVLGTLMLSPSVWAAPQGGQVTAGSGQISQSGATTTIQQNSQNLSLTWKSFNTDRGNTVNFVQPNATAVAVNRILDTNGTLFLGTLNANGVVYVINPNGVVFGQGAQVNVGGLVASTLDVSDKQIGSNRQTFSGNSAAGVSNAGTITASNGGSVVLLGNQVSNTGTIVAASGTVALGGGNTVSLTLDGNRLVKLQIDKNLYDTLVSNGGLIQANGGQVLLSAGAANSVVASVVNNTGVIEAHTVGGSAGHIELMGGMSAGTVNVGGTLDASAPNGGNGGFVETSAHTVRVADGTRVDTRAPQGQTGTWLIDPTDFTISSGGDAQTTSGIGAATLEANLGSNNITLQTANSSGNDKGDINVNAAVNWSANKLTLSAYRNINLNANLNGSGTAKLALEYGQGAVAAGNAASYKFNGGKIYLAAGDNFSTKLGSNGAVINYKVITSLGAAGSTTGTDLQGISGNLAGNYVLGADIDASGTSSWNSGAGFAPIGYNANTDSSANFTGIFDGLGHTISGLTINRPLQNDVGLFSAIGASSIVRNVGLVGGSITGNDYTGALAGDNYSGTTSYVYATGNVKGGNGVGGLIGYVGGSDGNSTISNAYASGNVSGLNNVGGLVGNIDGTSPTTITNVHATGDVSGTERVGGLIGNFLLSSVSNAYATGNVSSSTSVSNDFGGLIGYTTYSSITNAYATGNVSGHEIVGGLVGYSFNSTISNTYAKGNASGSANYVGGLVGYIDSDAKVSSPSTITNSYAMGNVLGTDVVGGLVGFSGGGSAISNVYATGEVSGNNYIGGLIGVNLGSSSITNAYATGKVSGADVVGGLAGSNEEGSTITKAYATGAVSSTANSFMGGLVGYNDANSSVTASYWNKESTGLAISQGGGTGLTTAEMHTASKFSGWDIDTTGGQNKTWRMYEGMTTPLLKAFMTTATVAAANKTTTYDGQDQSAYTVTLTDGSTVDSTKVLGTANMTCTQAGSPATCTNVGTYSVTYNGGLYSGQQGYDLVTSNTAATLQIDGSTSSATNDFLAAQLLQSAQQQNGTSTVRKTAQVGETFQLSSAESELEAELVNIGEQFAFKVKQHGVKLPAVLKP